MEKDRDINLATVIQAVKMLVVPEFNKIYYAFLMWQ